MSKTRDIQIRCNQEWSRLQEAWQATRISWNDEVAARFHKRFIAPWETEAPAFVRTLEVLDQEMQRCYRMLR